MSGRHWLLGAGLLLPVILHAATFELINADNPGVGLNDQTSFTPQGGNNATTLGQARINAFKAALQAWGARLSSNVPILVSASFASLGRCTSNTTTLAQTGAPYFFSDFSHAPLLNTFYPAALASALAGENVNYDSNDSAKTHRPDIDTEINSAVDADPACLGGRGFYYGFDNNAGSQIDFANVLMHELAHGLGFLSLVTPSTGANFAGQNGGESSAFVIFDHFVLDLPSNRTFDQMTDSERRAAAVDSGNLVWSGPNARAASSQLSAGVNNQYLQLYAPTQDSNGSSVSHWDTAENPELLMQPFIQSSVNRLRSVDFTTCALEDIGWTLTSGCPDGSGNNVSLNPPPSSGNSSNSRFGIAGAVDPVWLLTLLILAALRRRRLQFWG